MRHRMIAFVSISIMIVLVSLGSWAAPRVATAAEPSATGIELVKTVGLDPAQCAETSEITVTPGTMVTYCFEVTNNTGSALNRHSLADTHLGTVFTSLEMSVPPQQSRFVTVTSVITETTTNSAVWSAWTPGSPGIFTDADSATVTVIDAPAIAFTKTVGLDPAVCATTDEITVGPNTPVTYCYEVTNTGQVTLNLHDLVDSELGVLLDGFVFALAPQESVFITDTVLITETTVNTATWTAYNQGPTDVVEETDSATVTVEPIEVQVYYLPLIRRR